MNKTLKEPKEKKAENLDPEMQKDLSRAEGEGYAVMYQSEKSKRVEEIKKSAAQERGP